MGQYWLEASGSGTAWAEGTAAPLTFVKVNMSPMALHGKKWVENRSYPSNFADVLELEAQEVRRGSVILVNLGFVTVDSAAPNVSSRYKNQVMIGETNDRRSTERRKKLNSWNLVYLLAQQSLWIEHRGQR